MSWGITKPSTYYIHIVLLLECCSLGLINNLQLRFIKENFSDNPALWKGIILGTKGLLTLLSAPFIGALSDVLGRKPVLVLTVLGTCAPIPFMAASAWVNLALSTASGILAVTFPISCAYVADLVRDERMLSYVTFGRIFVTAGASTRIFTSLGGALRAHYGVNIVVSLSTAVSVLNLLYVYFIVPESLPLKLEGTCEDEDESASKNPGVLASIRKILTDKKMLLLWLMAFLAYIPDAGQSSCIYTYLQLVAGFEPGNAENHFAGMWIVSGVLLILGMGISINYFGTRDIILLGLLCQMIQLAMFGYVSNLQYLRIASVLAGLACITFPTFSAFAAARFDRDNQGLVQGMAQGMQSLCVLIGPLLFDYIFRLYKIELKPVSLISGNQTESPDMMDLIGNQTVSTTAASFPVFPLYEETERNPLLRETMPGPPFAFGSLITLIALILGFFLPRTFPKSYSQGECNDDAVNLEGVSQP